MRYYYLDASGWVKRYCKERGSALVNHLFARGLNIVCSSLGPVEVTAAMARKGKAGEMSSAALAASLEELERDWGQFVRMRLAQDVVESARQLAGSYALRAADAIHLASALLFRKRLAAGDEVVLVTSDQELKTAAQVSGLSVIDPEEEPAAP